MSNDSALGTWNRTKMTQVNRMIWLADRVWSVEKRSLKRKKEKVKWLSDGSIWPGSDIFSGQFVCLALRKNVLCCDWPFTAQVQKTIECMNLASIKTTWPSMTFWNFFCVRINLWNRAKIFIITFPLPQESDETEWFSRRSQSPLKLIINYYTNYFHHVNIIKYFRVRPLKYVHLKSNPFSDVSTSYHGC